MRVNGAEVPNDAIAGMDERGAFEIQEYAPDARNAKLCAVGPDVAILAYPVHERTVADGKPSTLDAFDLSAWVRRNRGRVCAAHTETIGRVGIARLQPDG